METQENAIEESPGLQQMFAARLEEFLNAFDDVVTLIRHTPGRVEKYNRAAVAQQALRLMTNSLAVDAGC